MSIFCSVKAGINCCKICNNDAYYPINRKAMRHPVMELLRCGHGMCENCYTSMVGFQGEFKCPFCRDQGRVYKGSAEDQSPIKESHTFRQYKAEFSHNPELIKYSRHVYVKLHQHIVGMWNMDQRAIKDARIKALRDTINQERMIEKAESRKRAICRICQKDTFTSEKQLWIHMKARHK